MWREDISSIIATAIEEVQQITGLTDDAPEMDALINRLELALDVSPLSHGEYRNYN
jgi:hypothetical protein